jgi:hypothetical protein
MSALELRFPDCADWASELFTCSFSLVTPMDTDVSFTLEPTAFPPIPPPPPEVEVTEKLGRPATAEVAGF